ncbi:unnamed protein product, partial [marine sediment metagenome]
MEEFEFPFIKRFVKMAHDKNLKFCLHVDGDITSLFPAFIEMGIDVVHP